MGYRAQPVMGAAGVDVMFSLWYRAGAMMFRIFLGIYLVAGVFGESGVASWYEVSCNSDGPNGKLGSTVTASGVVLDDGKLTCAHKSLPFGSLVRVVREDGKGSVDVVVTDRGPYKKGRIVDLSKAAAKEIGMMKKGVVRVKLEVLRRGWGRGE